MGTSVMTAHDGDQRVRKTRARVVEALRLRLPALPVEVVESRVEQAFAGYATAKIQDFVPILVERDLLQRLTAPDPSGHLSAAR